MPKKTLIITAIIVAVIAIGATATYITLRQGGEEVRRQEEVATTTEETTAQPGEPVIQPEEPTTTEPIDTSDWKTYRNEKYGFELKYPDDWLVEVRGNTVGFYSPLVPPELLGVHVAGRDVITAERISFSLPILASQFVEGMIAGKQEDKIAKIKIGNLYDGYNLRSGASLMALFRKGRNVYMLQLLLSPGAKEHLEERLTKGEFIFNHIIQSFRLLNDN